MNRKCSIYAVVLMIISLASFAANGQEQTVVENPNPGKDLFLQSKCITCHSIAFQGIKKASGEVDETGLMDLSTIGLSHNAEWMSNFLQKIEKKDGKKHPIKFKGSLEDLSTITRWLETLKPITKELKE